MSAGSPHPCSQQNIAVLNHVPGSNSNGHHSHLRGSARQRMVPYSLTQVLGDAKTQTTGEDPCPCVDQGSSVTVKKRLRFLFLMNSKLPTCALCCLHKAFPKCVPQPGLHLIHFIPSHQCHHQMRRGQTPLLSQHLVDFSWICGAGYPDKLD